jgi:hypothetical protein
LTGCNQEYSKELEYSGIEDEALLVESLTSLLEDQGGGSVPRCPEAVRESDGLVDGAPPPAFVEFVPRVDRELAALEKLLASDTPLMVPVRPAFVVKLAYGFMDASGEGSGSYVLGAEERNRMRVGFWCTEVSERSSNYREFRNLLEMVWDAAAAGRLAGAEVFMFTDNQVVERVYYKGSATEELLFEMVFELRLLALEAGFTLHVIHVAGTRLIDQGVDPLSRGERQLTGLIEPVKNTVPLHQHPSERSRGSWTG